MLTILYYNIVYYCKVLHCLYTIFCLHLVCRYPNQQWSVIWKVVENCRHQLYILNTVDINYISSFRSIDLIEKKNCFINKNILYLSIVLLKSKRILIFKSLILSNAHRFSHTSKTNNSISVNEMKIVYLSNVLGSV